MSSHVNRLLLTLLLLWPLGIRAADARSSAPCAQYHRDRVAYLLGCCGDQPRDYQGPLFNNLPPVERATKAIAEIASSRKLKCYKPGSTEFKILALNRIGALVMRARALSSRSSSEGDLAAALVDADTARKELQAFVKTNPKDAVAIWTWIALSFRSCGYTFQALSFLRGLPAHCCQQDEVDVLSGDMYFDLEIYDASAQCYSRWLGNDNQSPICGRDISLGQASQLRKRGFRIPEPTMTLQLLVRRKVPAIGHPFHVERRVRSAQSPAKNVTRKPAATSSSALDTTEVHWQIHQPGSAYGNCAPLNQPATLECTRTDSTTLSFI